MFLEFSDSLFGEEGGVAEIKDFLHWEGQDKSCRAEQEEGVNV